MCKREITIKVCIDSECTETRAYLHPRGCMHASRTHIDLPIVHPLLGELARKRGLHLDYTYIQGCIIAETGVATLRICRVPRPQSRRILLRMLKKGIVYIGL